MDIGAIISDFLARVAKREIDIYNEFSLQHEIGIHLRHALNPLKVQFERNVAYFGLDKARLDKREIDVAAFRGGKPLAGEIRKPTGAKDKVVHIAGSYDIQWQMLDEKRRFTVVNCGRDAQHTLHRPASKLGGRKHWRKQRSETRRG